MFVQAGVVGAIMPQLEQNIVDFSAFVKEQNTTQCVERLELEDGV